jgi:hypothetical protein
LSDLKLRNADIFKDKQFIGEGTYGVVYKAKMKQE